jgi:hypothetical protein
VLRIQVDRYIHCRITAVLKVSSYIITSIAASLNRTSCDATCTRLLYKINIVAEDMC